MTKRLNGTVIATNDYAYDIDVNRIAELAKRVF